MVTDTTEPQADDRALLKRLLLTLTDLSEAAGNLARLLGLHALTPPADHDSRKALLVAAIIAYTRPFSGNRAAEGVHGALPEGILDSLSAEQLALHRRLLTLRNKVLAHSDASEATIEVQIGEGSFSASIARTGAWEIQHEGFASLVSALWESVEAERGRVLERLPHERF